MGFFDFLRGGGKQEQPTEAPRDLGSLELSGLKDMLEKEMAGRMENEKERARELYGRMREKFREVKRLNSELSEKEFRSGQRMDAPVNMIKDNYVKKTLSSLNGLPVIQDFGYREISDFCSGTERVLKDMRNIPPKQAVLLSRYFKSETSKIVKMLKDIEGIRDEMKGVLDGKALWLSGEIEKRMERLAELEGKSQDLRNQEKTLIEKIGSKEKEIKEKEREMAKFVSGEDAKGFEKLGRKIKETEDEKSNVENELREELARVKRPLKKLEYSLKQDGKDKRLAKAAHSPMKALIGEGDSSLKEALVRVRGLMLKENEKEHVEELITKIENGYLSKLRDRYVFLEKEAREMKTMEEKSDVEERKKAKEMEIERMRKETKEYEKERGRLSEAIKDVQDTRESEKRKLEEVILSEMNVRISIK